MAAGKMSDTVIDNSCFDTPIVTGCLSGRIRTDEELTSYR